MENLVNKLRDNKKVNDLEVVVNKTKSSIGIMSKEIKEEKESDEQNKYMNYNSHVTEEQLASAIINSVGNEILNEGMRIPRIIFYFNLYIFKSSLEKKRVTFVNRDDGYGFEEMDGIFYLETKNVILNKQSSIPFLKRISFNLYPDRTTKSFTFKLDKDNEIFLKQKSLICMKVKNSFPLRYVNDKIKEKNNNKGINGTVSLIYNIIRKTKKFYEIAKLKGKKIKKIHILFLYDSFLQSNDDMENFKDILYNIFETLKIEINIETSFNIIYFVNPPCIYTRKLSDIVIKLKKENEDSKNIIEVLKKENNDTK